MRSVILASCNGEKFIGAQLDSITAQLGADDEIIVSDDCSTDGTVATVEARRDPRIRVMRNPERVGYIANFERAVSLARGDCVIFSDQDDIWLPGKVDRNTEALGRKACVVSDAVIVDTELNRLHDSYFRMRGLPNLSTLAVLLKPPFIGATMACRRDYLLLLLPFPKAIPHDFWITLNAVWDRSIEVTPEPLILYRRHPGTASVSATSRRRKWDTIAIERLRVASAILLRRTGRSIGARSYLS